MQYESLLALHAWFLYQVSTVIKISYIYIYIYIYISLLGGCYGYLWFINQLHPFCQNCVHWHNIIFEVESPIPQVGNTFSNRQVVATMVAY